jgi:hypothetical protein
VINHDRINDEKKKSDGDEDCTVGGIKWSKFGRSRRRQVHHLAMKAATTGRRCVVMAHYGVTYEMAAV